MEGFFFVCLGFPTFLLRCVVFFLGSQVLTQKFWRFSDTQARFFVVHFLEGWKILEKIEGYGPSEILDGMDIW